MTGLVGGDTRVALKSIFFNFFSAVFKRTRKTLERFLNFFRNIFQFFHDSLKLFARFVHAFRVRGGVKLRVLALFHQTVKHGKKIKIETPKGDSQEEAADGSSQMTFLGCTLRRKKRLVCVEWIAMAE
jgi:hypothetical protein